VTTCTLAPRLLKTLVLLAFASGLAGAAPRVFRVPLPASTHAPLPATVQVSKVVSATDAVWYLAQDCPAACSPAVYRWSQSGVSRFSVVSADGQVPALQDLVFAGNNIPLLVTNLGVFELTGDQFQPSQTIGGGVRALVSRQGALWVVRSDNTVSYVPFFPVSPATNPTAIPGPIRAWAAGSGATLWLAVDAASSSRLYQLAQDGELQEQAPPESLAVGRIQSLFTDLAGNPWISTADGRLIRRSGGFFDVFGVEDGLPGMPLTALQEDTLGNYYLLFGAPGAGIAPVLYGIPATSATAAKPEFVHFDFPDIHAPLQSVAIDIGNGTWIAAGQAGVFRVQGVGGLNWLRGWSEPAAATPSAAATRVESIGSPYVSLPTPAVAGGALGSIAAGKFTYLNSSNGLVADQVSSIVGDRLGNVYFTTGYTFNFTSELPNTAGSGIARWDHRTYTTFNTGNTGGMLPSNTVHASLYDATNDIIWFGTDQGLARFSPSTATFVAKYLNGINVRALKLDASGNLWVATLGAGVYKFQASTGTQLAQHTVASTGSLLASNQVTSLAVDGLSQLWAGTDGGGLSVLNTGTNVWQHITNATISGDGSRIFALETDASNGLWIGLPFHGILRRTSGGTFTDFTDPVNGLGTGSNRVFTIYRDGSNNLWFAFAYSGGIGNIAMSYLAASQVTLASPAFQTYNAANNGLPSNNVLSFFAESATSIWWGSPGNGATRYGGPVDAPGWPQALTGYVYFSSPTLADLDGDGKLEVIVGDSAGYIYAFRYDGTLLWRYNAQSAIPVGTPAGAIPIESSPSVADIDGDGKPEVVVGLNGMGLPGLPVGQGGVLVLSNTGTLKKIFYTYDITDFSRNGRQDGYTEGVFATPVLANVDDDPEPEIMVGAFDNLFYAWKSNGASIYSRDNDGDGQWDEDGAGDWTPWTPQDTSDDFPGWRGVDDDHNGVVDEGNAADDDEDGMIDEDPAEWPMLTGDTTVSSAVVGDILHNGKPAIIFGTDHLGNGTTTRYGILNVLDQTSKPLPGFPALNMEQMVWSSPVLVDLDGDGYWEIIHGSSTDLSGSPSRLVGQLVYAWRKDGTSFLSGTNGRLATTQGRTFGSFAVGDINNDGRPELVIATTSLRDASGNLIDASGNPTTQANAVGQMVYAFNSDGSLVPGFPVRPYPVNGGADLIGSATLADVNGDGYLEIIIPVAGGLVVLDHTGHAVPGMGVFENLQDISYTGEASSTPAVGDLDGSGTLKLVYALGTGTGSAGILHVVNIGPVNSTVQRSWPMFRRIPSHNAIFDVLVGDAQAIENSGTLTVIAQAFAGRTAIASVVADLSGFGGSSSQHLLDDGAHGDRSANDGFFAYQMPAASVAAGRYTIPITVTDGAGHTDTKTIFYIHSGTGKLLSVSKAAIDFGTVGQGLNGEMHFSVANAGSQNVTISAMTSSNPEFYVAIPSATPSSSPLIYPNYPTGGFPVVLGPGQTLSVRLRFHPNFNPAGGRSATLTIQSDDASNPSRSVSLTGTARTVAGGISLPANNISFVTTAVGSSFDVYYNIASVGAEPLIIKSIAISNPAFSVYKLSNPPYPRTFDPGVTAPYILRFRPTQAGNQTATLTITTNDPNNATLTVGLSGVATGGTPGCTYSLTPPNTAINYSGGDSLTFNVNTSANNCAWTVTTPVGWLKALPDSGTGNGTITYSVYPNYTTGTRVASLGVGGQSFTITQTGAPGTADQRFVQLLYFNFYGRRPSDAEVAFQVTNGVGPQGRAQVAYNFFTGPEFLNGGRYIAGLYFGLLGRAPDYNGWLFQRNAMARNIVDPFGLINNFLGGAEFGLKGTMTDTQFVTLLYNQILLRAPDPQGLANQVAGIQQYGRTQIAYNMLSSPEFQSLNGPAMSAYLLYSCLLQRDATPAETSAMIVQINQGATFLSLISNILATPEFALLNQ